MGLMSMLCRNKQNSCFCFMTCSLFWTESGYRKDHISRYLKTALTEKFYRSIIKYNTGDTAVHTGKLFLDL